MALRTCLYKRARTDCELNLIVKFSFWAVRLREFTKLRQRFGTHIYSFFCSKQMYVDKKESMCSETSSEI